MTKKRVLSAVLSTIALLAVCTTACTQSKTPEVTTEPPEVITESPEVTTPQTTPETTPPSTGSPVQAAVEVPAVVSAVSYTKQAIDPFYEGNDFEFIHSLDIPKIDSDAAGAAALNAKILADQQAKLDALQEGTEGNELYAVSYDTAACDGMLCIRVQEFTGWWYSEGGSADRFYYYDAVDDRELTLEEYLEHFSIQEDTLTKGFAWSNECASFFEGWITHTNPYSDSLLGDPISDEPEYGKFYYSETEYEQYDSTCKLIGVAVTDDVVRPYFSYLLYTAGTVFCDLDRESGKPLNPHYVCNIDVAAATEGETLRIEISDGKVTGLTLPQGINPYSMVLSSSSLYLTYGEDSISPLRNISLYINGQEMNTGYSAGVLDSEAGLYDTYRPFYDYFPPAELHTVELVPSSEQ